MNPIEIERADSSRQMEESISISDYFFPPNRGVKSISHQPSEYRRYDTRYSSAGGIIVDRRHQTSRKQIDIEYASKRISSNRYIIIQSHHHHYCYYYYSFNHHVYQTERIPKRHRRHDRGRHRGPMPPALQLLQEYDAAGPATLGRSTQTLPRRGGQLGQYGMLHHDSICRGWILEEIGTGRRE